jgi:hypothetical protein
MASDALHPLFAEIVRAHFPPFAVTALSPEGEEVEVCPTCSGLERLADAPCPACAPPEPCPPGCDWTKHETLEELERAHGRLF